MPGDYVEKIKKRLQKNIHKHEEVERQQQEIEKQLNESHAEINAKEAMISDLSMQLENLQKIVPSRDELTKKDKRILELEELLENLVEEIEKLGAENQRLSEQNRTKSDQILNLEQEINSLKEQIKAQEEKVDTQVRIYYAQVLANLEKMGRKDAISNLKTYLERFYSTTPEDESDPMVTFFKSLFTSAWAPKEAATKFLGNYPRFRLFSHFAGAESVLNEIAKRVTSPSMEMILCRLNSVGDGFDIQFQDDFFSLFLNMGRVKVEPYILAEKFLEDYPSYYLLGEGEKKILTAIKKKVNTANYAKLYSSIVSTEAGRIDARVIFHRIASNCNGQNINSSAKEVIRKTGTPFDGFWASFW